MRKRSELFITALQIPVDYLMLVISFVLAYLIREGSSKPFSVTISGHSYLNFMLVFLPIWLLIFASVGLYKMRSDRRNLIDFGNILAACASGVMVLIVIDFMSPSPIFPAKIIPVYGFMFALVLVSLGRILMGILQHTLSIFGIGVYRVLLIGEGSAADELLVALKTLKKRYRVVATLASLADATTTQLAQLHKLHQIDMVMVADNTNNEERAVDILSFCQTNHIGYQFVPTIAGLYTSRIATIQIGEIPILELKPTPLEGWSRVIKRLFDVIVTTIIVIVTFPLQLLIYAIIRLKDPGPAIYKHECYGRGGTRINVYKFRTMQAKYCLGAKFGGRTIEEVLKGLPKDKADEFRLTAKIKHDPRVSRLGQFLRRTSLDELPQLYNVLRGDLSLVGPRPLPKSELSLAGGVASLAKIVTIRPGITGMWQSSGRNDLEYSDRVRLNLFYIENWSLWLDIKIIIKTIWQAIFRHNGI